MILPFAFALAACLPVAPRADRIVAADLVPAFPEMATVDPAAPVGYAPFPGVARIFRPAELRTLAQRFGLAAAPDREICVERPVAVVAPAELLEAMKKALPAARIEILEYGRRPAPAGEIVFPRQGLREAMPNQTSLWNGAVHFGSSGRFAIWARVKITTAVERVLAVGDLKAGQPVQAGQVMLQTREEFPVSGNFAQTLDQVIGKWPRLSIRAGAELRVDQLMEPKEVARGDAVQVDIVAGAAHVEFEAIAGAAGAKGEMIPILNPASGKRFRARVEGKGRVSVDGAAKGTL